MKRELDRVEAGTFPCACCGKPVPLEKAISGVSFVFCTPSHYRKLVRELEVAGHSPAAIDGLLRAYHYVASCESKIKKPVSRKRVPFRFLNTMTRMGCGDFRDVVPVWNLLPDGAPERWTHYFGIMGGYDPADPWGHEKESSFYSQAEVSNGDAVPVITALAG